MKAFRDVLLASLLDFAYGGPVEDGLVLNLLGWLEGDALPLTPQPVEGISDRPYSPEKVERFRSRLREWIERLRKNQTVRLPRVAIVLQPQKSGGIARRYLSASPSEDVLLVAAALFLGERWEDVRFCADPQCGRPFMRSGRREYHSDSCSQRVRTARYLGEGRKK